MLDKARLSDYRVDADWFGTMETFGQDGPLAVRKATDKEPDMMNVLDDWARWKYDLDKVTDTESAWSVFQRICAEADMLGSYSTADVAGRAVELLTPHLDAERIVKRAVKLIRSTRNYGWSSWTLNGRLQFGFSNRPEGLATGLRGILFGSHGGRGNRLAVSGYAVAHAVWMLDEFLDAQDDSKPNIVEREVVPALICWHNDWIWSLRIAACLGGPDIGRFLWRQDWRAGADGVPFKQRMHLHGEDVNGWLFLLANLRTPLGDKFRHERARALMDMADKIRPESIEDYGLLGQNPFGFLFIDKRLALKYWPRFRARAASDGRGYRALRQQFHYLVNMEPVSTVDMYLDAWRGCWQDYGEFQDALSALDNLGESKKEKVISAIEQSIREDVSHIEGFPGDEDGCRDYLLRHIEDDEWTANRQARDIVENLEAGTDEYKGDAVGAWLEHAEPDHPLVKMLAESDQPQLRLLVMGAIRAHPTPENRAILQKLLEDPDQQVRAAAAEVRENLKDLAAAQFEELKGEGPPRFEISMKHVIVNNLLGLRQPIIVISIVVLLLLLAAGLSLRQLRSKTGRTTLSASAPPGTWTTQIAEAIVLLCAGSAILVFTATNRGTGGYLLNLGELRPEFARVNVMVSACAGAGVLLATLVCLFWRTWAATILMAVVLCGYGLVVNGPEQILESLVSPEGMRPTDWYTIRHTGDSSIRADLWVNGVYLGKTPVETTLTEFLEKVPYWPDPPEDFNDDVYKEPDYSDLGVHYRVRKKWIEFETPEQPKSRRERRAEEEPENELRRNDPNEWHKYLRHDRQPGRKYYAQVKSGDEWGYSANNRGSGGGGGGPVRRLHSHFGVVFPDRDRRLARLLDRARLSDYHVDQQWFKAAQTYDDDGWLAIRRAMDDEPQMLQVLDDWARWRYDLDNVTDAKSAWRAFERVCREADEKQYYVTTSIAGRAVELLVPKLDTERLVDRAVRIINSSPLYGWYLWRMNDRLQFGMSYRPKGMPTGTGGSGRWGGGRGGKLAISSYAVAHALWMLEESLRGDEEPNIIQERVVPALIRSYHDNIDIMGIAAHLGGPEIEEYLLRQNWRAKADNLPHRHQMDMAVGQQVNGWLYLLANLRSPLGRRFRLEHRQRIMEMADLAVQDNIHRLSEKLNFLFLDVNDLGEKSLAAEYWPRFNRVVRDGRTGSFALELQFEYLARIEPASTAEMYVQAWKNHRGDETEFYSALDKLRELTIPLAKRKQIHAALARAVQDDVSDITGYSDENRLRKDILMALKGRIPPWTEQDQAQHIFAQLQQEDAHYKPETVAAWLAHERPDHPLVKILADWEKPEFRSLVMGAIREHPTPHNREILQKLLSDESEQVRAAAGTVATQLEALSQLPPCDLASPPPERTLPL